MGAPGVDLTTLMEPTRLFMNLFLLKILKELKQALQNYGVNSPFTVGIVKGVAEGNRHSSRLADISKNT